MINQIIPRWKTKSRSDKGFKQKVLGDALETIFPDKNIITNARKQGQLTTCNPATYLEIDFYISELKLGFEYQDPHHYKTTWYAQSPLSFIQGKDDIKRVQVAERGESLISIPCWWDETAESLIATIRTYRPDLFKSSRSGTPIPLHPPFGYFKAPSIRRIGELMLPSVPSVPYDARNWWLSEKYDGIRAAWNSSEKKGCNNYRYSRYGSFLQVPKTFFASLSSGIILDGEIWFGRGNFTEAQNVARQDDDDNALHFSAHVRCVNNKQVEQFTKDHLWKHAGEGSVIRQPNSLYLPGRSDSLLKLKASRDGEALVMDVEDGLVKLQLPNMLTFSAELHPRCVAVPKKGDIVEFEYDSTAPKIGNPINPKIVRTRGDLIWENVVSNFNSISTDATYSYDGNLSSSSQTKPRGFWLDQELANTRVFFDTFARDLGRDPLLPSSWYDVSVRQFASKGGGYVLHHYGGSLIKALMDIYPTIGIEERKFQIVPRNFWQEEENKRNFFTSFARSRAFDPLDPNGWYAVTNQDIKNEKNGVSILNTYNGSLSKALSNLFPTMKIDAKKFHNTRFKFWQGKENQKEFFVSLAKLQKFDPLIPENWYPINLHTIISVKGGTSILRMYNMSAAKALISLFPHIGLQESKFACSDTYWKSVTHRRMFFEGIARHNNFDPLSINHWYHLPASHLREGELFIRKQYSGSYPTALIHSFPDLTFDSNQFVTVHL